jgi:hypothetical protein
VVVAEHGKTRDVLSPSLTLSDDSETGDIFIDTLKRANDTEVGRQSSFPASDMPPLPLAVASGTGSDITIVEHAPQTLTPGNYGNVLIRKEGVLRLKPGEEPGHPPENFRQPGGRREGARWRSDRPAHYRGSR